MEAALQRVVESLAGQLPSLGTRERRAHRRVRFAARALILDEGVETYASCVDLSMGGSGLRARELRIGSTIRLGIELEPGAWVHTNAEVVRVSEDFVGVRFVQLPQRALTAILSRVAQA